MKKTKKHFHCNKCGSACEIYKKGKKHRVLVCPHCGVIATNPSVVGRIIKRVGRGAVGEIPGASLVMEGVGLVGDLRKGKKSKKVSQDTPFFPKVESGKPSRSERIINKVLYGE